MIVFFDTEFEGMHPGAELIGIGFVPLYPSLPTLYIVLTDGWQESACADFTKRVVLPLLDRHDPARLTREQAAERIDQYIDELRAGPDQEIVFACSHGFDWQYMIELMPSFPGTEPWARQRGVVGRTVEQMLNGIVERACYFAATDRLAFSGTDQHNALVDAHLLRKCYLRATQHS